MAERGDPRGAHWPVRAAAILPLLLVGLVLAACGGTSKTLSTARTDSPGRELFVKTSFPHHLDPRYTRTYSKYVNCMRANGVRYPGLNSGSTPTLETLSKRSTFQEAETHCYSLLTAALRELPKARRDRALSLAKQKIQAFLEASRAHVVRYRVPSGSMSPTLEVGEFAYYKPLSGSPRIGDIVVFHPPEGAEQEQCGLIAHEQSTGAGACDRPVGKADTIKFIKRIVAGPGDTIYIKEGHVYRDGERERDRYIKTCTGSGECNFPSPIKIPAGHWFLMGDNRGESDDSRFWGPIPTDWILGVVRWCAVIHRPCAGS